MNVLRNGHGRLFRGAPAILLHSQSPTKKSAMLFSYNCHHFRPFHGRLGGRLCAFRMCFTHLLLKNNRCISNHDKTAILQQLCHQKADRRMPKNSKTVTGNPKRNPKSVHFSNPENGQHFMCHLFTWSNFGAQILGGKAAPH